MGFNTATLKQNSAFFHALSRTLTESTQSSYESLYKSAHSVRTLDLWGDYMPYFATESAVDAFSITHPGILKKYDKVTLTELSGSNGQAWHLSDNGKFVRPFMSPVDIPEATSSAPSYGLQARLYTAAGVEVPLDEYEWEIDYYAGIVKFAPTSTPSVIGIGTPKIKVCAYVGKTMYDVLSDMATYSLPVPGISDKGKQVTVTPDPQDENKLIYSLDFNKLTFTVKEITPVEGKSFVEVLNESPNYIVGAKENLIYKRISDGALYLHLAGMGSYGVGGSALGDSSILLYSVPQTDTQTVEYLRSGLVDGTSSISWDETSRTFTLAPLTDSIVVYFDGVKHDFGIASVIWEDLEGPKLVYLSVDGELRIASTDDESEVAGVFVIALFYWNSTDSTVVGGVVDKRQSDTMPVATQKFIKETNGVVSDSLVELNSITIGSGSLLSDLQFGVGAGKFHDAVYGYSANAFSLLTPGTLPVFYLDGTNLRVTETEGNPWKVGGSGLLAYNSQDGGSQIEALNGNHVYLHIICAACDFSSTVNGRAKGKYFAIQGSAAYSTPDAARVALADEISNLKTPLFNRKNCVLVASILSETRNAFTNASKARIVKSGASVYANWTNWSFINSLIPLSGSSTPINTVTSWNGVHAVDLAEGKLTHLVAAQGLTTFTFTDLKPLDASANKRSVLVRIDNSGNTYAVPLISFPVSWEWGLGIKPIGGMAAGSVAYLEVFNISDSKVFADWIDI